MNPWGLMFVALGFLMIVVGFKGSQHNVMKAFKGVTSNSSSGGTNKSNPKNVPPLQSTPNLM